MHLLKLGHLLTKNFTNSFGDAFMQSKELKFFTELADENNQKENGVTPHSKAKIHT